MVNEQLAQTIRTYAEAGNIEAIISLVDSFRAQRDRAELKVAAYLHEIKILAQRYSNITEPRVQAEGRPTGGRDRPTPQPSKPKKSGPQAIDIDL